MPRHGRLYSGGEIELSFVSKEEKVERSSPNSPFFCVQIGSSAFNLQRILHDRQEARSGVAKIRRLVGEEVEEGEEGPKYPRSMLKLELSDGESTVRVSFRVQLHIEAP